MLNKLLIIKLLNKRIVRKKSKKVAFFFLIIFQILNKDGEENLEKNIANITANRSDF